MLTAVSRGKEASAPQLSGTDIQTGNLALLHEGDRHSRVLTRKVSIEDTHSFHTNIRGL